jgi:uncharacterized damage-inducible protein DinB
MTATRALTGALTAGSTAASTAASTAERADLLEALAKARFFLTFPARDLSDEQARRRTTASELTVGGIIKHVTAVERNWARFIVDGPNAHPQVTPEAMAAHAGSFVMREDETLAQLVAAYAEVAAGTEALVAELPDLDATQPLPEAPWFEAGARWSARRVLLHLVAETAQHAGHADIIRQALDGARSMA